MSGYIGRFAPSPTGPLHAGSVLVALASWLDARANQGTWIIRIEDLDRDRCVSGVDLVILKQLSDCGLTSSVPVQWQSQRLGNYESAFKYLQSKNLTYPCHCTRAQILNHILNQSGEGGVGGERGERGERARHQSRIYPGTCRSLNQSLRTGGSAPCAWRFKVEPGVVHWNDRRLGPQQQDVSKEVGDFVIKRSDHVWAYQLSVVVDDAISQVTHIVRGADLVDNTARQIKLQQALGYPLPQYLHTKLILGPNGEKLSKQNGATPVNTQRPLECLNHAAQALGLQPRHSSVQEALEQWTQEWAALYSQN